MFVKGKSANPAGRPKGSKNKATQEIKQAFYEAFYERGGVKALLKWADESPTDFYRLAAKLIPVEIAGTFDHTVKSAEELSDNDLARIAAGSGKRTTAQATGPQTLN
jgi:hypothetical protein